MPTTAVTVLAVRVQNVPTTVAVVVVRTSPVCTDSRSGGTWPGCTGTWPEFTDSISCDIVVLNVPITVSVLVVRGRNVPISAVGILWLECSDNRSGSGGT